MPSTTTAVSFSCNSRSRIRAGVGALAAAGLVLLAESCATLPPPRSPEEALYRKRCANCHELHAPSEYVSADWERIMRQMSTNAGLSEAQSSGLLKWLKANSGSKTP